MLDIQLNTKHFPITGNGKIIHKLLNYSLLRYTLRGKPERVAARSGRRERSAGSQRTEARSAAPSQRAASCSSKCGVATLVTVSTAGSPEAPETPETPEQPETPETPEAVGAPASEHI